MNEISGRRFAGFIILAGAIVIGTILFGYLMSGCQATVPQPSAWATPNTEPSASGVVVPSVGASSPAASEPPATSTPTTSPSAAPISSPRPPRTPTPPTPTPHSGEPGPTIQVPPPIR